MKTYYGFKMFTINSKPTGIPSLGALKMETLFSTNVITVIQQDCENSSVLLQLNQETALLWNNIPVRWENWPWGKALLRLANSALLRLFCSILVCSVLPCSALVVLCSGPARQLQCFVFYVSDPAKESHTAVFRLWLKGKVQSWSQREAELYRQPSKPLITDWSTLMQMKTPNFRSLIVPNVLS